MNDKYGFPALFSLLVPGLGQIVKDDVAKGALIMISYVLSVMAMALFIGFITTPILHIWQVYDAYNAGK